MIKEEQQRLQKLSKDKERHLKLMRAKLKIFALNKLHEGNPDLKSQFWKKESKYSRKLGHKFNQAFLRS